MSSHTLGPAPEGSPEEPDAEEPASFADGINRKGVAKAVSDLWRDYYWPTKLSVLLLVLSLLWGLALAGWPALDAATPPPLRALSSSALQSLLTLIIGLFIAVNFYARARRGVLDGDDHYNIARALAFGYFKNFLVPALQLAARDGRELQVFWPKTMGDLTAYSRNIEPLLRSLFEHEWMPLVDTPLPGGPPRRTVLSLLQPRGEGPSARATGRNPALGEVVSVATAVVELVTALVPDVPYQKVTSGTGTSSPPVKEETESERGFFFDAPTALFTVQDFYAALNRRREDQHKEPINDQKVLAFQNGQIASFFTHLDLLFNTEAGLSAVSDLVSSMSALKDLQSGMRKVTMSELHRRYLTP